MLSEFHLGLHWLEKYSFRGFQNGLLRIHENQICIIIGRWILNIFNKDGHILHIRCAYLFIQSYDSKDYQMLQKKLDITRISCDSLHTWLKAQARFTAMVSSLIARRWVRPQTQ